jgi:hypothetical protein
MARDCHRMPENYKACPNRPSREGAGPLIIGR